MYDSDVERNCTVCGGDRSTEANPLLPVISEGETVEYIHLQCARASARYGFCWCCGESRVYYLEDLNPAAECEVHAGESISDYPEEDLDSYIENVRNNE